MRGELLLCFLQGDLSHTRFDLELFLLLRQPRLVRLHAGERIVQVGWRAGFRLGCLGACGALGPCLAVCFLLFLGASQAFLAQLEALFGMLGFLLFLFQRANFALGGAVVLHQGNARGADIGAGAAFDAVEQVVRLELIMLLA